jgi:Phosphotransferase enzyme family
MHSVLRMHADEVETDAALVRRLLTDQFPRWASLSIDPVPSWGTDNALYRVGDDMVVRLPRIERSVHALVKERTWLPMLAPRLPLRVPVPLAVGVPGRQVPVSSGVPRCAVGRRRHLGACSRMGALAGGRGALLQHDGDQFGARRRGAEVVALGARLGLTANSAGGGRLVRNRARALVSWAFGADYTGPYTPRRMAVTRTRE